MFAKRAAKKSKTRKGPLSEDADAASAGQEQPPNDAFTSNISASPKQDQHGESVSPERVEHVRIFKPRRNLTAGKHFIQAVSDREKIITGETLHGFKSDRKLNLNDDNRATAVFDVDTDKAHDHRAILERNAKIGEMIEKGELEAGIYRGQGAHRVYVKRREGALSNAKTTGLYGPVRGTNNVRMTMYVDYNPEICKDYKETGYCGFGNTCKFMHDRHDYKGGWQIDKEWEEMQKKKQEKLRRIAEGLADSDEDTDKSSDSGDPSEDEDGLPFACLKCREKWTEDMNPVVTRCGHYFCEDCAYSHYRTSIKCFQCGEETQGIFNVAHNLIKKIKSLEENRAHKEERRKRRRPIVGAVASADNESQSEEAGRSDTEERRSGSDGDSDSDGLAAELSTQEMSRSMAGCGKAV
ncbi:zinc finger (ccch type) motif-containing protein [Cystoisospora suis]|uniref:Zinc finger (Ccch type) motif-containing protein n=1 Tax=Cystoisospora suis TaxID=483139 RepID=A0A2C6KLT7_9APIC|nr:zinc finger (ccch type) motif-containing protein [Cystoisospora suis]